MSIIKPLVSIVVPVYNSEQYIEENIRSILNQSIKNIEIIVINDGSTDESRQVLERLVKFDSRIKLINQRNTGVSEARNRGIKLATGEYIGFVDSDDHIDKDMYKKMYEKAIESDSDIVVCNVNDVINNKKTISLQLKEGLIDVNNLTIDRFLKEEYPKLGTAVWHKIFRRELIKDNKIEFINYKEVSSEDTIFNYMSMIKSNRIYCIEEPLYDYIIRSESLTKRKDAKENMTYRALNTVNIMSRYNKENKIDSGNYIMYRTYWELINGLSYVNPENINNIKLNIKEYSNIASFNMTMKSIALSSKLDIYFTNHKGSYSFINKVFDKIFSLLCLFKLYTLAGAIHLVRIKRGNSIQRKSIRV